MATRVEELRKVILHDWWYESKAIDEVDALIAAAKDEGRAEGAEQEAAKIVHCYECVGGDEDTPAKEQCALWHEGKDDYCSSGERLSVPGSRERWHVRGMDDTLLAPATKEEVAK